MLHNLMLLQDNNNNNNKIKHKFNRLKKYPEDIAKKIGF